MAVNSLMLVGDLASDAIRRVEALEGRGRSNRGTDAGVLAPPLPGSCIPDQPALQSAVHVLQRPTQDRTAHEPRPAPVEQWVSAFGALGDLELGIQLHGGEPLLLDPSVELLASIARTQSPPVRRRRSGRSTS